jgi:hypothetical protein
MLNDFVLPAIKSDGALAENKDGVPRLQKAIESAANPIQPVPTLPAIAKEISGKVYTLEENPNGWKNFILSFEPGAGTVQVTTDLNDEPDEIGLDNIYRPGTPPIDQYMMRGRWVDDQTFRFVWTPLPLGNNGSAEIQVKYSGDNIEINIQSLILPGEPTIIKGKTD